MSKKNNAVSWELVLLLDWHGYYPIKMGVPAVIFLPFLDALFILRKPFCKKTLYLIYFFAAFLIAMV